MMIKDLITNLKHTYDLLISNNQFNEQQIDFMFTSVERAIDCLETIFEEELWKLEGENNEKN